MKISLIAVAAIGCLGLSACGDNPPQQNPALNSITGPARLDSGITSSNGGGQRALGDAPNVGIGTNGTTGGLAPNGKGNAY